MLQLIEKNHISHLVLVPTALGAITDMLNEQCSAERAPRLKQVLLLGEALQPSLIGTAQSFLRSATFHNIWGATEANWTTYECPQVGHGAPGALTALSTPSMPIGRPCGNTIVYVLNERRQLLPIGVVGELYVGGRDAVADGYHAHKELTASKFVKDPFEIFGSDLKMYSVGDLGRWRFDGQLELFGRADRQVKLRGFRIELGECEAALARVPGVSGGVVVKRASEPQCLLAFVEPVGMDTIAVRNACKAFLPAHAVPKWVFSEPLPKVSAPKMRPIKSADVNACRHFLTAAPEREERPPSSAAESGGH